jgi:protein SCO1
MKTLRIILWLLVAVAVLALAGLYLRQATQAPKPAAVQVGYGGPFTLIDANGQPFASSKLAGRPYAMFFGFTNCPDVCPTTLARLVRLRRQMGGDQVFQIVFISVDPERDGPAEVGRYTDLFDAPVVGLTGSTAQIAQVKKQYGISSEKSGAGETYSVDHTAAVLLFDKSAQFQSTIAPNESDQAAIAKLRRLTSG